MKKRVMVVEDDQDVRLLLRLLLEDEGYSVTEAATGTQALDRFAVDPAHLVLLDIRLPEMNGFEVCRALRQKSDIPIIMVTAQDDSHDVVAGLEAGADDYVMKPFVDKELLARVRAQLRRAHGGMRSPDLLMAKDLEIRPDEGLVLRGGEPIALTRTEFNLLVHFAMNPNRVHTREMLLEQVWGYQSGGDDRLVDAHVRRLRTKIESDPSNPVIIQTVRGLGYKLVP
ncbi:MAG: response regulator [Acidimicrobiia bacterium]